MAEQVAASTFAHLSACRTSIREKPDVAGIVINQFNVCSGQRDRSVIWHCQLFRKMLIYLVDSVELVFDIQGKCTFLSRLLGSQPRFLEGTAIVEGGAG